MAPPSRPTQSDAREALRDEFLRCYENLSAQKIGLLNNPDEGSTRKQATELLLGTLVRSVSLLLSISNFFL